MNNNFADRLQERIDEMNNPTCLGLDPMLSYLCLLYTSRCV